MYIQYDVACCIFILFVIFNPARSDLQNFRKIQHRAVHLPDTKFSFNEYSDNDNDDRDKVPAAPQWNGLRLVNHNGRIPNITTDPSTHLPNTFDKHILWDSHWAHNLVLGQISAVAIDPNGNIAVFHRGSRVWGDTTFNEENKFNRNEGPVKENTIILLDKSGRKLSQWGRNMFYLPHGLTIDSHGNYWITDVAMHQVFKFDAKDIEKHIKETLTDQTGGRHYNSDISPINDHESNKVLERSILKPSLSLGEPFEPGNDERRFCKPTAVAVRKNGDFFVSDGYCNSRIIKYNARGERISQWGRRWGIGGLMYMQPPPPNAFFVPHALALADEYNYIYVADRENGRALCFFANNGTFHKEYKHPLIGTKVYSVAYAKEKLYLINGPDVRSNNIHIRGFILDINSGNVLSQFGPGEDMNRPHDITVSENGSEIYVVELDKHVIYRFLQDVNASAQTGNLMSDINPHHESAPLTDSSSNSSSSGGTTTATLVLSLVTAAIIFIALCIAIAAVVARYQKRGCLLTMRKRMRWEAERHENFKLSSLLEGRRGKGFKILEKRPNPRDFSKLNTEPETSEDEHPENSLTRII